MLSENFEGKDFILVSCAVQILGLHAVVVLPVGHVLAEELLSFGPIPHLCTAMVMCVLGEDEAIMSKYRTLDTGRSFVLFDFLSKGSAGCLERLCRRRFFSGPLFAGDADQTQAAVGPSASFRLK